MDIVWLYEQLEIVARTKGDIFSVLRDAPVDAVGLALLGVPEEYPHARAALPRMASQDVQDHWTGSHGFPLLLESCAFMRAIEVGYVRHTGKQLAGKKVLDYGCGWGRMIRLMYKFTPPENIYGCDPQDESIELCVQNGLQASFMVCDYIPKDSPFPGVKFELIYAFSVFTHLSERTAAAVIGACRESIADSGLLAITVRPATYWDLEVAANAKVDRAQMKRDHERHGFAFTPHKREAIDGEITYGDTSITIAFMKEHWPSWEVVGVDGYLQDPYQTVVFLKPTP
jgi:SAM-dependent methyltransferase